MQDVLLKFTMFRQFVVCSLLVGSLQAVFVDRNLPVHDLYKPGDLLLAGMLPRSKQEHGRTCGSAKSAISIQGGQAMRYALDRLSSNNAILPNLTLGYVLMDDCNKEAVALVKSTQLIPVTTCVKSGCNGGGQVSSLPNHVLTAGSNPQYEVVGVVGPFGSTLQLRTSLLMSFYNLPHISWIATSDALSDKARYEYFTRVVPPDRYQARALVDIIKHYNWTYISTLYSQGSYGSSGIKYIHQKTNELRICVAYSAELRDDFTDEDYKHVFLQLMKNRKARVVVLFVEGRHGRGIFKAITNGNAAAEFILLSSEGLGTNAVYDLTNVKKNWITLSPMSGRDKAFNAYYKTLSPFGIGDRIWSGEYTENQLDCTWDLPKESNRSCHRFKTFNDVKGHVVTNWPARIIDSVDTFGFALHNLISEMCPEAFADKSLLKECISGQELLKYIRNVQFKGASTDIEFDKLGDLVGGAYSIISISYDTKETLTNIGQWHTKTGEVEIKEDLILWWKRAKSGSYFLEKGIPESTCAKPCKAGEIYLMGELSCCWECHRCRENEYLKSDRIECHVCPFKTWPDQINFTSCEPIPPTYMLWTDPIAIALAAGAAVMFLLTLIITCNFIKQKNKQVIKGASLELMVPISLGLLVAFATVYFFIARAVNWLCYINYFGFNFSTTLIFGPLFLKTVRVYRIFALVGRRDSKICGVDSVTQVAGQLVIFALQIGIMITMCLYEPPVAEETMPVANKKHVELSCKFEALNLLPPLFYNIIILVLCTIFGFLTRKLPDNFNESWYIFISVITTLFVWIAFLPTYFIAFYAFHKSALLGLAMILNGTVTILFFFAPKMYAVHFLEEDQIKMTNMESQSQSQSEMM